LGEKLGFWLGHEEFAPQDGEPSVNVKAKIWKKRRDSLLLFAGVFGFRVQSGEVGVAVLQHFVLVAVSQLSGERAVLGTAVAFGTLSVVFDRSFAHTFVRPSRCGVGHRTLL
jgi:hypothetical protein